MTDIRRTLLWVVFTMSLVLLWDAWQKHTGHPSIFGGPGKPTASAGTAPAAGGAASAAAVPGLGVPAPAGALPGAPSVAAGLPGASPGLSAAQAERAEQVVITTDVTKATFDSQGGSLVRLELLNYRDHVDRQRSVVLLDSAGKRLYLAQTGLVTSQAGVTLPNHQTLMTVIPGERSLAAGATKF